MTSEKVFVLDANVLIDPARTYYAFDLVPAFWRLMVDLAKSGKDRKYRSCPCRTSEGQ